MNSVNDSIKFAAFLWTRDFSINIELKKTRAATKKIVKLIGLSVSPTKKSGNLTGQTVNLKSYFLSRGTVKPLKFTE